MVQFASKKKANHMARFSLIHYAVYYTLDGRRLSGKPSARGMYIQGGKKLFIP